MKTTFHQALFAAVFIPGVAHADAPAISSEPLGYTTTKLYGSHTNGSRKTNFVSPNLVNPASWYGAVESIDGDRLVLTGASLTSGAFNAPSLSPKRYAYYINTNDGYWAHIVSNDQNSLTLPAGFAANFSVGEAVLIRRHLTIADYLGNNEVGLRANDSGVFSLADKISIIDQENNGTNIIIPSSALGGKWLTDTFEDGATFPIYPDQGIQISRSLPGDLVLETVGEVDSKSRQIQITTGTNLRPLVLPVETKLSELGLYTGDPATGLVASENGIVSQSDNVRVTVNGVTSTYFYSSSDLGSGPGWYDTSFQYAGDQILPVGAALIIKRSNPVNSSPFVWKSPAPGIQ
jgi:hypothetical protein